MDIGNRIKERRKALGMSVDDLAYEIEKNRTTVYRYENGNIEKLPTNVLDPLAKALRTTPEYLIGWGKNATSKEVEQMKEEVIENLLDGITALNYRQWEMLKTSVDIAFKAKVKDTRVHFSEEVRNLIHEDLTEDE